MRTSMSRQWYELRSSFTSPYATLPHSIHLVLFLCLIYVKAVRDGLYHRFHNVM